MNGQMMFSNASIPITTAINLIGTVNFGGLDLRPAYQRGYVWSDDFKDKLIYSIIKQYPIGNISVRVLENKNDKGALQEVVDGQQRLTTISNFIKGEYNVRNEWSRKIIEVIKEYFGENYSGDDKKVEKIKRKLLNKGNISLKYKDLPDVIQGNIQAYNLAMTYIAKASDTQVREYFRFLQNQERLRAGEIINSMPASNLEIFLDKIEDKNRFLNIIGFADDRKEFDKIFYSMIGLFDKKIPFGTTDKSIQNYASKADLPKEGLDKVNVMIEQINIISTLEDKVISVSRKRFLKYLLLLIGLSLVDFKEKTIEKLNKLKNIDDELSVFFSAKANAVESGFKDVPKDVVEEFRHIALLTKASHPLIRVENRMEILAYYVNNHDKKLIASGIEVI